METWFVQSSFIGIFFGSFFLLNQKSEDISIAQNILQQANIEEINDHSKIREFVKESTKSCKIKLILYAAFTIIDAGFINDENLNWQEFVIRYPDILGDYHYEDNDLRSLSRFIFYLESLVPIVEKFTSNPQRGKKGILFFGAVLLENHPQNRYILGGKDKIGPMTLIREKLVEFIGHTEIFSRPNRV